MVNQTKVIKMRSQNEINLANQKRFEEREAKLQQMIDKHRKEREKIIAGVIEYKVN